MASMQALNVGAATAWLGRSLLAILLFTISAAAQTTPAQTPAIPRLAITLHDAIALAQKYSVEFGAARTAAGTAQANATIARSTLLPNAKVDGQYLYTQGTGVNDPAFPGGTPVFIANNAVNEYIAQGDVHQDLSLALAYDYRRAQADARLATARLEIAKRGLVVVVVQRFYGLAVAQRKLATAQSAQEAAQNFLKLSQQLEAGGEVAHSDVIKAQIEANIKQRAYQDAALALENARLDLGLLLFKDFNQNFSIADDLSTPAPLPSMDDVIAQAKQKSPEVAAALAAKQSADFEVTSARSDYLPALGFDYWYGIDSNRLAWQINGARNVGNAAAATLTIPLWNWGATRAKVHQAELARSQAQLELTTAQKTLLAQIQSLYAEARIADEQFESLRVTASLAADSLRLTLDRYRAGEATALEVVDAQNTLATARDAYDDGELRYHVALANLQTLTGTLTP